MSRTVVFAPNDANHVLVPPGDDYRRIGMAAVYDPTITPVWDRVVVKLSTEGKAIAAFRIYDPLTEQVIGDATFPVPGSNEIIALTLMLDTDQLKATTILELQARTFGATLRIYCAEFHPERSAVDRLAELV